MARTKKHRASGTRVGHSLPGVHFGGSPSGGFKRKGHLRAKHRAKSLRA